MTTVVSSFLNRSSSLMFEFQPKCCDHSSAFIFSSPEPKARDELIGRDLSWRPSVRPCVYAYVRPSTLSNMNISETSLPIVIEFHLEHQWVGRLTALG